MSAVPVVTTPRSRSDDDLANAFYCFLAVVLVLSVIVGVSMAIKAARSPALSTTTTARSSLPGVLSCGTLCESPCPACPTSTCDLIAGVPCGTSHNPGPVALGQYSLPTGGIPEGGLSPAEIGAIPFTDPADPTRASFYFPNGLMRCCTFQTNNVFLSSQPFQTGWTTCPNITSQARYSPFSGYPAWDANSAVDWSGAGIPFPSSDQTSDGWWLSLLSSGPTGPITDPTYAPSAPFNLSKIGWNWTHFADRPQNQRWGMEQIVPPTPGAPPFYAVYVEMPGCGAPCQRLYLTVFYDTGQNLAVTLHPRIAADLTVNSWLGPGHSPGLADQCFQIEVVDGPDAAPNGLGVGRWDADINNVVRPNCTWCPLPQGGFLDPYSCAFFYEPGLTALLTPWGAGSRWFRLIYQRSNPGTGRVDYPEYSYYYLCRLPLSSGSPYASDQFASLGVRNIDPGSSYRTDPNGWWRLTPGADEPPSYGAVPDFFHLGAPCIPPCAGGAAGGVNSRRA